MKNDMKTYIQPHMEVMPCVTGYAVCNVSNPLGINIGSQISETGVVGD